MTRFDGVELPPASLRKMIEAFPGGFAYLDSRLVFAFCNDVQAGYFGRRPDEIIGRRLQDVVPNNPEFWLDVERVARTGERLPKTALSVTWSTALEEEHHYVVSYISDVGPGGTMDGVFMTALEVTPALVGEGEIETTLRERNNELQEIIKERDLLVGIVSHELRTPLTSIFGNAHLLLHRLADLDEESRTRAVVDIRTEAERLNRLVENMLLLARQGSQDVVPTEPVILDETIGEVVSEQRKRFDSRPITISVKPRGLMAEAQPDYLRQVLSNLLANAEKYSPPDEPIDVRARRSGKEVKISILDHGSGIDPKEAEIVFQPFYRSARTSTTVAGAGIGLAVCKLLVQAQSGRIWTRARRREGAIFSFTLAAVE